MVKNTYIKNLKELKIFATDERDYIVNSFKNGTLFDYLSDRVLDIDFDNDGDPEYLYFTLGSPTVYLTLGSNKGIVFAEQMGHIERSTISWFIWLEIEILILDFFENVSLVDQNKIGINIDMEVLK